MIKKAYAYLRVSKEDINKPKLTIEAQLLRIQEYAKNNNIKIVKVYQDRGISASSITKRKSFVEMLNNLDNIDMILFSQLDRFSRNVLDANSLLAELERHNVGFKAVDEDDIDTTTADGRFIFNLKVNLAERERLKDSERIQAVFNHKVSIGEVLTGRPPLGYKIKDKHLIIDEDKAEIVRKIYNHFLTTQSKQQTLIYINYELNYKMSITTLKKVLKNEIYTGKYRTNDNYCPPIIDKDIFEEVQSLNDNAVKWCASKYDYIFSGLVVCGNCNYNMVGTTGWKVKNGYTHVYYCSPRDLRRDCPNRHQYVEERVEKYILNNVLKELDKISVSIEKSPRTQKNNNADIKKKIVKLNDLYLNDLITMQELKKRKAELESLLVEETKKVDTKKIKALLSDVLKDNYNTFTNLEKRTLWYSIIDKIIIYDYNHIDIIFKK